MFYGLLVKKKITFALLIGIICSRNDFVKTYKYASFIEDIAVDYNLDMAHANNSLCTPNDVYWQRTQSTETFCKIQCHFDKSMPIHDEIEMF